MRPGVEQALEACNKAIILKTLILSEARSRRAGERKSKDLCIFFSLQIRKPIGSQIPPRGIHTHNQLHLLDPCPALQLLFTSQGAIYVFEFFPIHKLVKFVSAAKTFKDTRFVLKDAIPILAGNPDVKILRAVCHDVHVEPFFGIHRSLRLALIPARRDAGVAQDDNMRALSS